ncbi:trypsin-5-like [Drosophila grimshawi]|uniref:trypsin-5-like n=1 Tax=Drosophila grimshawi TaxID=7222 RepID=UPI000C870073|nr:trypsin-5-like [Drosophila grimshawi]
MARQLEQLQQLPQHVAVTHCHVSQTVIENAPWQVSLQYLGQHDCGGSTYSAEIIINAAHYMTKIKTLDQQIPTILSYYVYVSLTLGKRNDLRLQSEERRSGGPLVIIKELVGVDSFGTKNCTCPSVYAQMPIQTIII